MYDRKLPKTINEFQQYTQWEVSRNICQLAHCTCRNFPKTDEIPYIKLYCVCVLYMLPLQISALVVCTVFGSLALGGDWLFICIQTELYNLKFIITKLVDNWVFLWYFYQVPCAYLILSIIFLITPLPWVNLLIFYWSLSLQFSTEKMYFSY